MAGRKVFKKKLAAPDGQGTRPHSGLRAPVPGISVLPFAFAMARLAPVIIGGPPAAMAFPLGRKLPPALPILMGKPLQAPGGHVGLSFCGIASSAQTAGLEGPGPFAARRAGLAPGKLSPLSQEAAVHAYASAIARPELPAAFTANSIGHAPPPGKPCLENRRLCNSCDLLMQFM